MRIRSLILGFIATACLIAGITLAVTPAEASPRSQAIGTAQDYLRYTAFSKAGLSHQLQYEGFSRATSDYAVNHISVSWKYQAVRKAKSYLRYSHFSCSGLIHQLDYEKFLHWQSVYGARHTSAC
jgi:Host cell surface-exposed lipoprotein